MKYKYIVACSFIILFSCSKSQTPNNPPAVVPAIQSISPTQGAPGTTFVITGTNLNITTGVSINGTEVFYKIDNNGQVEAEVPSTAQSGTIAILYSGGSVPSSGSFTVLPPVDMTAPVITNLFPSSNPVGGPVLILGQNIDSISGISFNGVAAEIDTNFTGTVTTIVPLGVQAGLIELTVTKKNGTSGQAPFRVITNYPVYTGAIPPKIMIERQAPYIVHVANDWFNEYATNGDNILIDSPFSGTPLNMGGTEQLNGNDYSFYVSAIDRVNKTIELTVNRAVDAYGDSVNVLYEGNFTQGIDAQHQRIIFYNEDGRQIVIRTGL